MRDKGGKIPPSPKFFGILTSEYNTSTTLDFTG